MARAQLAEIDPATDKVIARIDLPGARGNHGLLLVPAQRLAFIACEDNARLLMLNLASRRVVATFAVGGDPDVLAFDPALQRLYVAGERGIVSAFALQHGALHLLGEARLGPDAHVVAVDPATHRVYFPLQDLHGKTALRIMAASRCVDPAGSLRKVSMPARSVRTHRDALTSARPHCNASSSRGCCAPAADACRRNASCGASWSPHWRPRWSSSSA